MTLYRWVFPYDFYYDTEHHAELNRAIIEELKNHPQAKDDDHIIITKADLDRVEGGTNTLKVICIGEELS